MTLMTTEELAEMFGDRPMHPDRPRGSIERGRRRVASVIMASPGDPYTSLPAGMLEPGAERIWPGYGPPMARRLEVERAVREGTKRFGRDRGYDMDREPRMVEALLHRIVGVGLVSPVFFAHIWAAWRDQHAR